MYVPCERLWHFQSLYLQISSSSSNIGSMATRSHRYVFKRLGWDYLGVPRTIWMICWPIPSVTAPARCGSQVAPRIAQKGNFPPDHRLLPRQQSPARPMIIWIHLHLESSYAIMRYPCSGYKLVPSGCFTIPNHDCLEFWNFGTCR